MRSDWLPSILNEFAYFINSIIKIIFTYIRRNNFISIKKLIIFISSFHKYCTHIKIMQFYSVISWRV